MSEKELGVAWGIQMDAEWAAGSAENLEVGLGDATVSESGEVSEHATAKGLGYAWGEMMEEK